MQNSLPDMLNHCSEALIIEWLAEFFFFSSCSRKKNEPYGTSCTGSSSCVGRLWLCDSWGQSQGMGTGEGKGEMRESSTKLAQSLPGEGAAWGCLASFISLGLSTRVFITKERREPMWGKDTGLATGSLLCLGREYSYQPIWCLPESLSIVPSTQTCPALRHPHPYHQSCQYLELISLLQEPPSLEYLSTFYMVSRERTK